MEHTIKDKKGVIMDKRIKLLEKIKIQLQGHIFVGEEKREGWKTYTPVYMFKCSKHGYVKSTVKGHMKRLDCPQCLEEIKNTKEELTAKIA